MIKNYIKIAWRTLLNNKAFSIINIFGLAAGLASCMFICLYIYDELNFDKHHKNVEQLYQVNTEFLNSDGNKITPASPGGLGSALQQEFPEIVNWTRLASLFVDDKTLIKYEENGVSKAFYETKGYLTENSFFSFFNYDFIEGNAQSVLVNPNTIVISEDIAAKIFGNQSALNKVLRVESNSNGSDNFTVTGVFKIPQSPTHIDARFFMPVKGGGIDNYLRQQPGMAGNNFFYTYVHLKKGTKPVQLEAKFPAFVDKYMGKDLKQAGFGKRQFLTNVTDIHLSSVVADNVTEGGSWVYLSILISIALFTLLIACINFMNLSTARSSNRSNEVGVRKVLGAERKGLIGQFLSESILLSIIAFVFAIGLVKVLNPIFETVSGKNVHFTTIRYVGFAAVFLGLTLITGLLAGSYPAFYLSSFQPIKVLKGRFSNSLAVANLRKGLVVFQFTISVILIIASMVIHNQMDFLRSKDLGFTKDQQIVIPLRSETAKGSYTILKNALNTNSQIQSVGASAYYPGIFNPEDANFYREGQNINEAKRISTNRIDKNYLQTLDIQPIAGRIFSDTYPNDSSYLLVVNEKAVKELGFDNAESAVGKKVFGIGPIGEKQIIGVVKDFHFEDLKSPIAPFGFTLNESTNFNYLIVHAKSKDISAALASLEKTWKQANPTEPLEYSFLDDDFQKNYQAEMRLSSIVGYFTFIAILISCLGLFGLATFSAEQRTKEIGVRKVLGANMGNLVGLLSKEFLKLVVLAILLASPIAWIAMHKWLQNFAYSQDINWEVFALTTFITLLIAFVTMSFQAIKAAIANPIKSLRME